MARIQLLGPPGKLARLMPYLANDTLSAEPEFLISFGYRKVITDPMLTRYAGKIVNLHISALPWNRGSNPNYWSWKENTPKGVTVHIVDAGVDTGPTLGCWEYDMDPRDHTLRTSYAFLEDKLVELFAMLWAPFVAGRIDPFVQPAGGSEHFGKVELPDLDTPIDRLWR